MSLCNNENEDMRSIGARGWEYGSRGQGAGNMVVEGQGAGCMELGGKGL